MKAGPHGQEVNCPRCGVGRAIWRCKDCADKRATCVLCCRNAHRLDLFHRIEKWNGRFYQEAALWQVGVKIYLGHNGQRCPRSSSALVGLNNCIVGRGKERAEILNQVAECMGLSQTDVLETMSDALEHPQGSMSQIQRDLLHLSAERAGISVLDLIQHLRTEIANDAEESADALQAESDKASVQAEVQEDTGSRDEDLAVLLEEDMDADDDNWEDEDSRPARGDVPRFLPRPPPSDGAGNKFLTVVHTNGFHALPVVWCECQDHPKDRDLQLLEQHLYPASYDRIKTVFTFTCLDDHRFEYLECKSSHYQYHNKLRRWTCPQSPDSAPNRYKELSRVARQWRNLKYRKWFWILHNSNGKRGEMALFCAACPQDGVNLPPEWEAEQAVNPWVIMKVLGAPDD